MSGSTERSRRLLGRGDTLHGGRFIVEEVLGSGGEGVVYRAHDSERDAQVAIKTLHLDGSRSTSALKREFRVLRGLVHPGLVYLYELFVDADDAFFSMAYVRGEHFSHLADFARIERAVAELADALSFLHRAGRVHRDVKPSNVLVEATGRVVLVDFGVALDLTGQSEDAATVAGTPIYMAPELRLGERATPKSDAYAVGVMLYETLTGRHPLLHRAREGGMFDRTLCPSSIRPDVPRLLDVLCERLLDPNHATRASVDDVLTMLRGNAEYSVFEVEAGTETTRHVRGRKREFERLEVTFGQMLENGEPIVVHLSGEAGVGKSALVDAFVARKSGEALVLAGRCHEREFVSHKAFDTVIDALVAALGSRPDEEIVRLVSKGEAELLVPLFPQLCQVRAISALAGDEVRTSVDEEPQRRRSRAYDALALVLSRLSDQKPLVVAIDDLQWGDRESARLLYSVFAGPTRPRALLILSYRSGERGRSACLSELLDGNRCLQDELRSVEVPLEPLGPDETEKLVHGLLDHHGQRSNQSNRIAQAVWNASRGNPRLATEFVRHLLDSGTEPGDESTLDLDQVIESRVRKMSLPAERLFEFVCTARVLPRAVASELLGAEAVERAEGELRRARLLSDGEVDGRLVPRHDGVERAGIRHVGTRLRDVHAQLARAFEAKGGDAAIVARHAARGGLGEKAVLWAERGGDEAGEALAFGRAAELYRIALAQEIDDETRQRLERKLAESLSDAGRGTEAAPLFLELARSAPVSEAVDFRCRAAAQWLVSGDIERGQEVLRTVFREVGLGWPTTPGEAVRHLLKTRFVSRFVEEPDELEPGRAPQLVESLKFEACRAAWSVGYVSTIHGAANSAEYLLLAKRHGAAEHLATAYGMEALYLAVGGVGAQAKVEEYRRRAEQWTRVPRSVPEQAFLEYVTSQSEYLLGNLDKAVVHYEKGDAYFVAGCRGAAWEMNSSRIFWGSALYYLGRHLEMDRRIRTWIADAQDREDKYTTTALEILRARRVGMPDGNWDEAYEVVRRAMSDWHSPYFGVHHSYEAFFLAHAALCQGRPDVTCELMDEVLVRMKKAHMHRVQVVRVHQSHYAAYGHLARASSATGSERKRAMRAARRFVRRLTRERVPMARAFARYVEGSLEVLEGDLEAGLVSLEASVVLFERVGLALHAEGARHRIGELVQGDRGVLLRSRAETALLRQGIRDHRGALRVLAPGPEI